MLAGVRVPWRRHTVATPAGHTLHTLSATTTEAAPTTTTAAAAMAATDGGKPPLLLVHGFGGGLGLWARNFDALARDFSVHAIDVLGFGRSARPELTDSAVTTTATTTTTTTAAAAATTPGERAEAALVDSIEQWRAAMGYDKLCLVGHSFGGYLVGAYALRYPERCSHVVLADPWGMLPPPPDAAERMERMLPWHKRMLVKVLAAANPLAALRWAGPWGVSLVRRTRPDLAAKFAELPADTVFEYIYHLNAQDPAGERAFGAIAQRFRYAQRPLAPRLAAELPAHVPVTVLHGSHSWLDRHAGDVLRSARESVRVRVVPNAGHHIYIDNADAFNELVAEVAPLLNHAPPPRAHWV